MKEMTISPKGLKLAILISLGIVLLREFNPTIHLLFFIFMLAVVTIHIIRERKRIAEKVDVKRLAPAAACIILIVAFSLLGYYHNKSRYDQFREQCLALAGTFDPGDPPAVLQSRPSKPPTCTH